MIVLTEPGLQAGSHSILVAARFREPASRSRVAGDRFSEPIMTTFIPLEIRHGLLLDLDSVQIWGWMKNA